MSLSAARMAFTGLRPTMARATRLRAAWRDPGRLVDLFPVLEAGPPP